MSARTLPSGQEEVDQYGDSSTGLHRACGDHLAGCAQCGHRPQGPAHRSEKAVSRCTRTHGRQGPQGHSSASHRRPETHHGRVGCATEVRSEGAQRRQFPLTADGSPTRVRHVRSSGGSWAEVRHRCPGRGGAVELRECDEWFRSVVVRSLRWSLLLWLRLSPTGSPVAAGFRPSRRLRLVHLCVGFTWNMSAPACSSTPASRSVRTAVRLCGCLRACVYLCACVSLCRNVCVCCCVGLYSQRQFLRITAPCRCDDSCLRAAALVCVRSRVDHAVCAVRLRRSGRCAHGRGPPE